MRVVTVAHVLRKVVSYFATPALIRRLVKSHSHSHKQKKGFELSKNGKWEMKTDVCREFSLVNSTV